uniref:Uncharacterized protein n=1 Tax=Timema poppense TaxID=170557 RepID=A0A7R9HCK8_TIMPO|nr:unnamed protein product [Timema poppensis]
MEGASVTTSKGYDPGPSDRKQHCIGKVRVLHNEAFGVCAVLVQPGIFFFSGAQHRRFTATPPKQTTSCVRSGRSRQLRLYTYANGEMTTFVPQVRNEKTEEFHQVNRDKPSVHTHQSLLITNGQREDSLTSGSSTPVSSPRPIRKSIPPRFVTPLVGRIVDQGADVTLVGIIDGELSQC